MDSTIYPDSHLSEEGKKQRSILIKQLLQQATKVKNEKIVSASNPSYLVTRYTNSIEYHRSQLEEHIKVRDEHIKKIQAEYERKVKQTNEAIFMAEEKLKQENSKKSKSLILAELTFQSLKEKYENVFGSCPVTVVDTQESSLISPALPVSAPAPQQIVLTSVIETPLTQVPEPAKPIPEPAKPTPRPVVEIVQEEPNFYYTNDESNPFITKEEVEILKESCIRRGKPFPYKLSTTRPVPVALPDLPPPVKSSAKERLIKKKDHKPQLQ